MSGTATDVRLCFAVEQTSGLLTEQYPIYDFAYSDASRKIYPLNISVDVSATFYCAVVPNFTTTTCTKESFPVPDAVLTSLLQTFLSSAWLTTRPPSRRL